MNFSLAMRCSLIALLIFMTVVFGVEAFIFGSEIGYDFATTQHSLFWLFVGLYCISSTLSACARSFAILEGIAKTSMLWGARLLFWWLTTSIVLCIILRLDFSVSGLSSTLFFFLIPGEFITRLVHLECFDVLSGFEMFVVAATICCVLMGGLLWRRYSFDNSSDNG